MIDIPINKVKKRLKTRRENGHTYIWDIIRKKYVLLLPEELVRQMLINYLVNDIGYPASHINVEKSVNTNDKKGRYDIIIYDRKVNPWMIIECKSHKVKLDQKTADQVNGYNHTLKANHFMLSNGINTLCYRLDSSSGSFIKIEDLPLYE